MTSSLTRMETLRLKGFLYLFLLYKELQKHKRNTYTNMCFTHFSTMLVCENVPLAFNLPVDGTNYFTDIIFQTKLNSIEFYIVYIHFLCDV